MNLPHVDLMVHFADSHSAETAFMGLVKVAELFAVRVSVGDVEDISKDGGAGKLDPVQVFAAVH